MDNTHLWYALVSKPRHEKVVDRILRNKGLEPFLPLYRTRRNWSDRIKEIYLPLFPGYIFCRFDYGERLRVLTTPGVLSIVGWTNTPSPVSDHEIAGIQAILDSGLPACPWRYAHIGDTVRIERGPLAGLEGVLVREKDATRVVVSVELLRRAVAVEVGRDVIEPAGRPKTGCFNN